MPQQRNPTLKRRAPADLPQAPAAQLEPDAVPAPARAGRWYVRWDRGEVFQVTAVEADSGRVRIEGFDGSGEILDADGWRALSPRPTASPAGRLRCPHNGTSAGTRIIWTEPTLG